MTILIDEKMEGFGIEVEEMMGLEVDEEGWRVDRQGLGCGCGKDMFKWEWDAVPK